MQGHSQAVEDEGSGGEARPPAMSPVQRRIVLGMLVGLLAFVGTLKRYGDLSFVPDWIDLDALWMGLYLTSFTFVATWLALSPRPLSKRLPAALWLGVILALAQAWSLSHQSPGGPPFTSPTIWVLVASLSVVAVLGVMGIWRRRYGWRITLGHEAAMPPDRGRQFSLRQMCGWMAGTAVILAMARSIGALDSHALPAGVLMAYLITGVFFTVVNFLGLPLMVPCVGLVLAEQGNRRFAFWVAAMAVVVGGLEFSAVFLVTLEDAPVDIIEVGRLVTPLVGSFELGLLAVALGGLGVLRACGYRLIRLRRGAADGMVEPEVSRRAEALRGGALRRRWWQSPFPYVVVAMAGVAGGLGWPAWQSHTAIRKEILRLRLAKEWEENLGAEHCSPYGEGLSVYFSKGQPLPAAALTKLGEADAAESVVVLDLWGTGVTDEQMRCLAGLRSLKHLNLADTQITDAGLEHLRSLTGLENLFLDRTRVTDKGMEVVAELKGLWGLGLDGTRITDAGLARLHVLTGLEFVRLSSAPVTAQGVAKVREALPQCQVIDAGAGLP